MIKNLTRIKGCLGSKKICELRNSDRNKHRWKLYPAAAISYFFSYWSLKGLDYIINSYNRFKKQYWIKCKITIVIKKHRNEAFCLTKCQFWGTWQSKLSCHGNVNVYVHVIRYLKCSESNLRKNPLHTPVWI